MARLAAVQALYQMEISGAGVEAVVREFAAHRFDHDLEGEQLAAADEAFFADLLRNVVLDRARIDAVISAHLVAGWRLERLDATVRAILRCGICELLRERGTPAGIAIDEYVEVAKSFFGSGSETGFINAVLDKASDHDHAA